MIGPKVKLLAVVKSNAYGHGLVSFAREMATLGVDYIGVDSIVEAVRLRREGIKIPILVLGYTQPTNFLSAVEAGVELTISSFESLEYLLKNKKSFSEKKLKIHLKVDTGMHRQGFLLDEFPRALNLLKKLKGEVEVVGIFSHFASASDEEFTDKSQNQISEFKKFVKLLAQAGFDLDKISKHLCATGATFNYPDAHFDMVRVGLGMYGLWPSEELEEKFSKKYPLKPTLEWKTILSEIKILTEDGKIGYDFTEEVRKGMRIAILPIGYWHGFPRALSSIGEVLVNGKSAKVLGRVSMDMIAIDVSKISDAKVGDEVTIIGEQITAGDIAKKINTSSYEIITRINPLIKKFYI